MHEQEEVVTQSFQNFSRLLRQLYLFRGSCACQADTRPRPGIPRTRIPDLHKSRSQSQQGRGILPPRNAPSSDSVARFEIFCVIEEPTLLSK